MPFYGCGQMEKANHPRMRCQDTSTIDISPLNFSIFDIYLLGKAGVLLGLWLVASHGTPAVTQDVGRIAHRLELRWGCDGWHHHALPHWRHKWTRHLRKVQKILRHDVIAPISQNIQHWTPNILTAIDEGCCYYDETYVPDTNNTL